MELNDSIKLSYGGAFPIEKLGDLKQPNDRLILISVQMACLIVPVRVYSFYEQLVFSFMMRCVVRLFSLAQTITIVLNTEKKRIKNNIAPLSE